MNFSRSSNSKKGLTKEFPIVRLRKNVQRTGVPPGKGGHNDVSTLCTPKRES